MSFKINNDNYEIYKRVLDIYWQHLFKTMDSKMQSEVSGLSPLEALNKSETEIPKSKLYSGLKQAVADAVSNMKDHPKFADDINTDLTANNLPSVHTLKGLLADSANKVIQRKKIKNADEYYVVKELIDGTTSDITNDERTILSRLLTDFETKTTTR